MGFDEVKKRREERVFIKQQKMVAVTYLDEKILGGSAFADRQGTLTNLSINKPFAFSLIVLCHTSFLTHSICVSI